jgi:hypothetical protein
MKVFGKAIGMVIVLEGGFAFFISRGELSTSLSDVSLITIGAGEFVCS